jgi:cytokinin trans-hydroxylase
MNVPVANNHRNFIPHDYCMLGSGRQAPEDTIINGILFPKGTFIVANFYAIHRSVECWGKDATEFVPERWSNPDNIPRDAFYPFSAGSRNCIGQK